MTAIRYRPEGDVAVLEIVNPPVNALSRAVRIDLLAALERAMSDAAVVAIVIRGDGDTFAAGADIRELVSGVALEAPTSRDVQGRLETLTKPVIAAIDGVALGGGLELALACHARVATPRARIGLPEVKLGLLPGGGGTQRFTRLAGPEAALEALTSGSTLSAARAQELGLIDARVPDAGAAAIAYARQVVAERRPLRIAAQEDGRITGVDPALFASCRERLARAARGQLAPLCIVDCIEAACTRPREEGFALERRLFLECRTSPQHRALTHLFFAEREARKVPGLSPDVAPLPVRSAAVVGAGTMGGGIAMCFANANIPVTVLEASEAALARGLDLVRGNYAQSVARGSLDAARAEAARARITGTTDAAALGSADIVVEAVFENLDLKREVFARLDRDAAPHAILASNTSSLDIDAIAAATARPAQVVGMHFFSPANVMKLLENVRGSATSARTLATVMALGRTLGKVAVLAGNCEGFIGNRMLAFYIAEAEFLLEEGATPEQIDRVAEDFGFRMGPLAVRDLAGNDVGLQVRRGRRLPADERWSPILERLVAAGRLGQKSGRGFYRYEGRTRIPDPEVTALIEAVARERGIRRRDIPDEEILDRLLHPLVNEGARLLAEGIAARAGDIDLVYVHGYGFPAYRGGPMFWAREAGPGRVVETMRRLAPTHGARWRPAPLLEALATQGGDWDAVAGAREAAPP